MKSIRLNEIVRLCKNAKRVADIGCDHGLVLGELATSGADFLVASDISKPCAQKANILLKHLDFGNFDVRVGNGLDTITDEDRLDLAIIAGMGGYEIIEILSRNKINIPRFVLQPQNNVKRLRTFLFENNFNIIKDYVVKDGDKFYNILSVKSDNISHKLTKRQIVYGKTNLTTFNADFVEMLMQENTKLKLRLNQINDPQLRQEIMKNISDNSHEIQLANLRRK